MSRKWMVTIWGIDGNYNPMHEMLTLEIDLKDNETPIDWFKKKPKVYCRFEFVPHALINFWEMGKEK